MALESTLTARGLLVEDEDQREEMKSVLLVADGGR